MKQKAIVTLPITPRENPKLGLMFIPFIMDVLSKRIGIEQVLGLNVHGLKLIDKNAEEQVLGYIKEIVNLGITPDFIWRDDQNENVYWINKFFRKLVANGYIIKDNRLIMCCPCKAVETLSSAGNASPKKRLYDDKVTYMRCKVCRGIVTQELKAVYLFKIPRFQLSSNLIFPNFLQKEISNTAKKFAGVELLISRSRPSAISLWTGKEHIFLDVDFGWQLYLPMLRRYGYDPVVLIGSQENLFGCYLALLLLHLVDTRTTALVVPAYCREKQTDNAVLNSFKNWDKNITRLFLASHITFRRKETYWDSSLIGLIKAVVNNLHEHEIPVLYQELQEVLNTCEGSKVRQLLSMARSKGKFDDLLVNLIRKEKI
ncbi:MAG TPA: hypothetical protein VFM02_00680 [Candidatus Paceibacterota bacterium]|nr:hypothetical protein [Candidatus Paceibacterota bacterium]